MKQSDSYDRSIHRTGRLGSILAIAWMLGIPAVMCTVYHMFPSIPDPVSYTHLRNMMRPLTNGSRSAPRRL